MGGDSGKPAAPADPLLGLLRQRYGGVWTIRRTSHLWIATADDPDADHAPTIVQPDVETFIRELEDPPARAGRSFSLLSAVWFAQRLDRIGGDGAWIDPRPPMC